MKRFLSTLLIIALCIVAFPLQANAAGINKQIIVLNSSETYTLKIIGVSGKITWKSLDEGIATVSKNGMVTAVSQGTTTVTGNSKGITYKCKVVVTTAKKDYTIYEVNKIMAIYKGISDGYICFHFINISDVYYMLETTDFVVDGTTYYKNHTGITFKPHTDNYFIYKAKIDDNDVKNVSGNFICTKDNKKVFDFDYNIDIE